jgi:hypothetical protein
MNNLYIYNKLTYFPCKTWWRIASCMHWEDEFRCISMIFGKFNVILVVFCL